MHVDYNKVYACFGFEHFLNTPLKFSNREARPGAPALDPSLWFMLIIRNIINISGIWSAIIVNLIKISTSVLLNYPEITKMCLHHMRVLFCEVSLESFYQKMSGSASFGKSMDRLWIIKTTHTMIWYKMKFIRFNWFKLYILELWCDDFSCNETSTAQALATCIYMGHLSLYLYNKVHNSGSENHRCNTIFS